MATIKDLFRKQNKDLYGLSGKLFIESRGLINAPRAAALLTSSPNALADLIGGQIGGALGGSANRPTDTIFKSDKAILNPPISFGKTQQGLKDAIDPNTAYFVKDTPSPASIIAKLNQGGSSPAGMAAAAAASALNTFGSAKALNKLKDKLKGKGAEQDEYGMKWKMKMDGKRIKTDEKGIKFTTHYKDKDGKLLPRVNTKLVNGHTPFDIVNHSLITALALNDNIGPTQLKDIGKNNQYVQTPYVLIQRYGKNNDNIILPGTISGITDEATPEWSNFKFVGSPFQQYRYMGVERSISFSVKLYFTDIDSMGSMKRTLNKLRALVHPDEEIAVITYENNGGYSPLGFNGNFVYLTLNGLYENLFGFIESLSIEIDDSASWATADMNNAYDGSTMKPYPTVINVSIGFKVINTPKIVEDKNNKDKKLYEYNFTGEPTIMESGEAKTAQTPAASTTSTEGAQPAASTAAAAPAPYVPTPSQIQAREFLKNREEYQKRQQEEIERNRANGLSDDGTSPIILTPRHKYKEENARRQAAASANNGN